ncbi:Hypothetical predicted protein [Pelobates cultripes]|uniref:Uncharacterized protein n=1 Tax=Pelobates cultripes TaxID=61616 RepID=A0AAD1VYQ7_PELCU|nr:Hypothetical predicted protein [Pelobates cultripes]
MLPEQYPGPWCAGGEDPRELLTGLFTQLLGDTGPPDYGMVAHRALRAPRGHGQPLDIICRLMSFPLKESLMQASRAKQTIAYLDSRVSLYQDLSTITLDDCRALRPLTQMLQEKRIRYKWVFPFRLQAKVDNTWHVMAQRCPTFSQDNQTTPGVNLKLDLRRPTGARIRPHEGGSQPVSNPETATTQRRAHRSRGINSLPPCPHWHKANHPHPQDPGNTTVCASGLSPPPPGSGLGTHGRLLPPSRSGGERPGPEEMGRLLSHTKHYLSTTTCGLWGLGGGRDGTGDNAA